MSGSWFPSYFNTGLRFARRNAGKIILLTAATTGAVAAATYLRKQFSVVNETLEEERQHGARKLRLAFISNTRTVCTVLRDLLPVAQSVLSECKQVDADSLVEKLRQKPMSKIEKQQLWERVKVASITHLVSVAYVIALLHSFLSLQMNLVARYSSRNLDAPVQALPSGLLSSVTSKRFLYLAQKNMLRQRRIEDVVRQVEAVVQARVRDVSLVGKMGRQEVGCLLEDILDTIRDNAVGLADAEASSSSVAHSDTPILFLRPTWAFEGSQSTIADVGGDDDDLNYRWLVQESLDLCEVLDYTDVVQNCASIVISYALESLEADLVSSGRTNNLAFAHLLAHFSSQATKILSFSGSEDDIGDAENVSEYPGEWRSLERLICQDENNAHFAASVFLSGEKEKEPLPMERENRAQVVSTPVPAVELPVTDISDSGEPAESGDLGLMFDIEQVDR